MVFGRARWLEIGTYHREADISDFERWSIVSSIASDCYHLAIRVQLTRDDSLN